MLHLPFVDSAQGTKVYLLSTTVFQLCVFTIPEACVQNSAQTTGLTI